MELLSRLESLGFQDIFGPGPYPILHEHIPKLGKGTSASVRKLSRFLICNTTLERMLLVTT